MYFSASISEYVREPNSDPFSFMRFCIPRGTVGLEGTCELCLYLPGPQAFCAQRETRNGGRSKLHSFRKYFPYSVTCQLFIKLITPRVNL
jgi:hypothetical protein